MCKDTKASNSPRPILLLSLALLLALTTGCGLDSRYGAGRHNEVCRLTGRGQRHDYQGEDPENPRKRFLERLYDRGGNRDLLGRDLLRAKREMDRMPPPKPGVIGTGIRAGGGIHEWEWLGPGNIGGRIRSLVINPHDSDEMWAGAVSGGIWHTTNWGASWHPANDFLPSLAVSCMAIDPNSQDILYAGTGLGFNEMISIPGAGILQSTDGGITWEQIKTTATWPAIYRIAAHRCKNCTSRTTVMVVATEKDMQHSFDQGENWQKVYDGRVIDVKFIDARHLVAGRHNGEILYSEDSGRNWSKAKLTPKDVFRTILKEDFEPDKDDDPDTIKVDSTAGIIAGDRLELDGKESVRVHEVIDGHTLLVDDLDKSYDEKDRILSLIKGCVELAVQKDSDSGIVYASIDVGGGTIWCSKDYGKTFELVETADKTPDYLVTDSGRSQGSYDNAIWVSRYDSSLVVVGGIDLWRSSDGGKSWQKISDWHRYHNEKDSAHADQHLIISSPISHAIVYVANDGGVQRTFDIHGSFNNGSGWENLAHNLGVTQFYQGAAASDGSFIIGGCQDNGVIKLEKDAGINEWYQCLVCTGDGGYCAIDQDNNRLTYASFQNLLFVKSQTYGASYLPSITGLEEAGNEERTRFIAPFAMCPTNSNILVAGGSRIWWTTNRANSWVKIRAAYPPADNPPLCSTIEITPGKDFFIWAGYDDGRVARCYCSDEHVGAWEDLDDSEVSPLPDNCTVTDIAVNPHDPDEVFVTLGEMHNGCGDWKNVWFSDTGGHSWKLRVGSGSHRLPRVHVNTVTFHPADPNMVYVGTDIGVFTSNDKGQNWNKITDGPVYTEVDHLFWQKDYLLAATHGRGMWRTRPILPIYVDLHNTGFQDGTYIHPYRSIKKAIAVAPRHAAIIIRSGKYQETGDVLINKPLDLQTPPGGEVIIE